MAKKKIREAARILNCLPSRDTEKDWGFDAASAAGVAAGEEAALPESVDRREDWWSIGDQEDTGSCVGWGVGDSVIRWHLHKAGKIQANDRLSVRYLWMAAKETDKFYNRPTTFIESEGTSLKAALDVARKFGVVLEEVVPFLKGRMYLGKANDFYATAAMMRISAYFNLGRIQAYWRSWLANNGPIVTRLDVDTTWDRASSTDGILETFHPEATRGGHAIAIVGYRPGYFIVRNSWGEGWGDHGFGYASLEYARDAFTETYGIKVS